MKMSKWLAGFILSAMVCFPVYAQEAVQPAAAPAALPSEQTVADMASLPEPMKYMKDKYALAIELNKLAPSADRDAKIKAFVDDMADYDDLAQRSLGERWDKLDAANQAEFKAVFREMIELMYSKKIADKQFNENKKIEWDRVVKTKTSATVSCFTQQKDVETELEIVLHPGIVSWKVYDVLVDGASLSNTYRKKYAKQLDEKGIDSILDDMKKEIESLKAK